MRISDWSSDVCSSDLGAGRRRFRIHGKDSCPAYVGFAGDMPTLRRKSTIRGCRVKNPVLIARLTRWNRPVSSRQSGRSSGVEHNLAKVGVEGSNPFARSSFPQKISHLVSRGQRRSEEHTSELQSLMRI